MLIRLLALVTLTFALTLTACGSEETCTRPEPGYWQATWTELSGDCNFGTFTEPLVIESGSSFEYSGEGCSGRRELDEASCELSLQESCYHDGITMEWVGQLDVSPDLVEGVMRIDMSDGIESCRSEVRVVYRLQ